MKTLYCNYCDERKPATEFYKTNKSRCKECVKEVNEDDDNLQHIRPSNQKSIWTGDRGYVEVDIVSRDSFDLEPYLAAHSYGDLLSLMSWERIHQLMLWTDFGHFNDGGDTYTFLSTYFQDILNCYVLETEYEKLHQINPYIYLAFMNYRDHGNIRPEYTETTTPKKWPLLYYLDREAYREFTG